MAISLQVLYLFVLAIPVACIAWTVTHEEVFREPREYCAGRCKNSRSLAVRKFFYLFTCEYCFSHFLAVAIISTALLPAVRKLYRKQMRHQTEKNE